VPPGVKLASGTVVSAVSAVEAEDPHRKRRKTYDLANRTAELPPKSFCLPSASTGPTVSEPIVGIQNVVLR